MSTNCRNQAFQGKRRTILTSIGTMKIDQDTDLVLLGPRHGPQHAIPRVGVDVGKVGEGRVGAPSGTSAPVTDGETKGVDAHAGELGDVVLCDPVVPMPLEFLLSARDAVPASSDVNLGLLGSSGAGEGRVVHPLFVDGPIKRHVGSAT